MSDYTLQIKIKNAPMLNIMRLNNIETAADLSRACGVSQVQIGKFLNLKEAPLSKYGEWRLPVLRIADCLKVIPEMLFPEHHYVKPLDKNTIEATVSLDQVKALQAREQFYLDEDEDDGLILDEVLSTLPKRTKEIVKKVCCDEMTLKEVGNQYSISADRVRQIKQKALRILRHPSRAKKIRHLIY